MMFQRESHIDYEFHFVLCSEKMHRLTIQVHVTIPTSINTKQQHILDSDQVDCVMQCIADLTHLQSNLLMKQLRNFEWCSRFCLRRAALAALHKQ